MQISLNKGCWSLTLDSVHEKFDISTSPKGRFPIGVKSRAGNVVLRVDWLIMADAKCRAEKLTSSQLFHNGIVARATF